MSNRNGKRTMCAAAVVVCGVMLGMIPAEAQQDVSPPPAQSDSQGPPQGGMGRGGRMDPARRAQMLRQRLGLSDDQTAAVTQILVDERAKMKAAMQAGEQMSRETRGAVMVETSEKIKALLTADQKVKYDAMEAEMRARMQERQGGGAPPQ